MVLSSDLSRAKHTQAYPSLHDAESSPHNRESGLIQINESPEFFGDSLKSDLDEDGKLIRRSGSCRGRR
jgi:hypothetical protein